MGYCEQTGDWIYDDQVCSHQPPLTDQELRHGAGLGPASDDANMRREADGGWPTEELCYRSETVETMLFTAPDGTTFGEREAQAREWHDDRDTSLSQWASHAERTDSDAETACRAAPQPDIAS
jgi:hypothetical protein